MKKLVHIHPRDNVAVALTPIEKGSPVPLEDTVLTVLEDIPQGHKVALRPIAAGEEILKYGYPIGRATRDIPAGGWVHTQHVKTGLDESAVYRYEPMACTLPPVPPATFRGYLRADGRVAVRNEVWILPTVGCANDVCTRLAQDAAAQAEALGLDGVYAFPHPYGCSQMGEDHAATRKLLAALARHPNAGGVLVVGLGCENNTLAGFRQELGSWDDRQTRFLCCQDEPDELAAGQALLEQLMAHAATAQRQDVAASKLVVGMKCGGSDGLSGITANAVVGAFSDLLVAQGGSTVLTEVPEMFGAEALLMNRAASPEIYRRLVDMIEGFKRYFTAHGQVVYENPSPGNKEGGITTLEDKSLGCVQKGGSAPVVDVIGYGEQVRKQGLTLLDGPGNDLVSTTALTAAGAHIILFTTGRGTPFGAPAVTMKISSNTGLFQKKPGWIDFNAGTVAESETVQQAAGRLMAEVLAVAGGKCTQSERSGYRGIAIFKDGVTL